MESISIQLQKLNLKRVTVIGDGNCQYRALAYNINKKPKIHNELLIFSFSNFIFL